MTIDMEYGEIRRQIDIEYSELREQFINISKLHLSASHIHLLKLKYSTVINSTRTADKIDSIEGLLRILEKRGALSYDNIEVLNYISETYVLDNVLDRALRNYEARRRPSLPAYNRYLVQSGKYLRERQTKSKAIASNQSIIPNVSSAENEIEITTGDENENFNCVSEVPARNRTSSEDLTTPETETLFLNSVSTSFTEQRKIGNSSSFFGKVRDKICSRYGIRVVGTFLGAILIIVLICISNILSVESPAGSTPFVVQPGTSGLETIYNNASQSSTQSQSMQMMLYTTRPVFPTILPGSIGAGPSNQSPISNSPTDHESEVMRRVFQEISERLGRNWRDVARHLRVTEYDIDEINQLNLSLHEKALKALLKFQDKCDPLQWKSKLKYALDKARRRDLMELVDELSSRKY